MKARLFVMITVVFLLSLVLVGNFSHSTTKAKAATSLASQKKEPANDQLVYADFETKNDRPASSRGGFVQLFAFQENQQASPKLKGRAGAEPPAPDLSKSDKDSNSAATFEYELFAPNQFAGVGMIVIGLPVQGGKFVADDVSSYSSLTLQASATGVSALTIEFLSQGQGINISVGSPQATIQLTPDLRVYKIPLTGLAQPAWAPVKVSTNDVLKKLTAINFIVGCGPCTPTKGKVVLDNIVFHR